MKALIVKDSIKLPLGSTRSSYPKGEGVYIVDDEVAYSLVVIDKSMSDDFIPYGAMIPRDSVVKEYERIGERDIDLLQKQLSELQYTIKTNSESIINLLDKDVTSGDSIDLKDLTKLIAVAQKPELLDKKVG